MNRPSFAVVSFVVATLVCVGAFVHMAQPFIPPPPANRLGGEHDPFLRQAAYEPIDWRVYGPEAFRIARQEGRPILLVVGAGWSRTARQLDRYVFTDEDIANYLSRNFVCVRIDGDVRPEWLNALLPFARFRIGFLEGLQMWVLDPRGRLLDFFGRTGSTTLLDKNSLIRGFIEAKDRYEQQEDSPNSTGKAQQDDKNLLNQPGPPVAPLAAYTNELANLIDRNRGGFPLRGIQQLYPNAWRYQLEVGRLYDLHTSLDPVLLSPLVNLPDGGFFRLSETPDMRTVEFDQTAVENAEMMHLLALAGQIEHDRFYRRLAEMTFDHLANDMVVDGVLVPYIPGDEGRDGRSQRSSFSPRRMRQELDSDERDWAQSNLGLVVGANPEMVPYLASRAALMHSDGWFERVRRRLREAAGPPVMPSFAPRLLDVDGHVAARMIETARIWGDAGRLQQALTLAQTLDDYVDEGGYLRALTPDPPTEPLLLADLAYSDAKLQSFLATGRFVDFQRGLDALEKARIQFKTGLPGDFTLVPKSDDPLGVQDVDVPELADNTRESGTAQMIRLCHAYGRLLSQASHGPDLEKTAYDCIARFSGFAVDGGAEVGGYFAAAANVQDDTYAVAVGANAMDLSAKLFQLAPTRLVAPAIGDVRADLRKRPPGLYIVRGTAVVGPFDVKVAATELPAQLRLGLSDGGS